MENGIKINKSNTPIIKDCADNIIEILKEKGFIIQRYDALSTNSIYLKLDYGVCNSIRISDHPGKKYLCYRYNIILGCDDNIVEEKYIRYYFNENNITGLTNQIMFDKIQRINKYGKESYRRIVKSNKAKHENEPGFWKDSKLITNDSTVNTFTNLQSPKKISNNIIASGCPEAVEMLEKAIDNQNKLDAISKFHPGDSIKITISPSNLAEYYLKNGIENNMTDAATHVKKVHGSVGTIIGANNFSQGKFYSIEFPLQPFECLPENFINYI
jgi:hypothetical protein